jgi:hypothetical protein
MGVHSYINVLASSLGTYLYGRRMYETMVFWETAHDISVDGAELAAQSTQ